MNYIIKKLSDTDDNEMDWICGLLKTEFDPVISNYFIFRDKNYRNYLKTSLAGSVDTIYIITQGSGQLIGFGHFKLLDNTLLLNNIVVIKEYRGKNLALKLIEYGQDAVAHNCFAVDVFEKNTHALQWYKRLGMNIVGQKYWYNLIDYYNEIPDIPSSIASIPDRISIMKDTYGFSQIYNGDHRIGTLIEGDTMLVHFLPEHNLLIQLKRYFGEALRNIGLISELILEFPVLDHSFRLTKNSSL